jgi:hypothetical protein
MLESTAFATSVDLITMTYTARSSGSLAALCLTVLLSIVICGIAPISGRAQSTAAAADPFVQAKDSMVLVYPSGLDPCGKPADTLKFLGSGFLLTVPGTHTTPYLITNKHVIDKQKSVIVRANAGKGCICREVILNSEGAQATVIMPNQASVNLVAVALPAMPDVRPLIVNPKMLVDFEALRALPITEGHDIYAPDIFIPGEGATAENYSFIRNGKIALVRTDNWMQSVHGNAQAYLGQLSTTFGATGVPVFLSDSRRILGVTKAIAFSPAPVCVDVPETKLEDGIAVPQTVGAKGAAIIPNGVVFIEPAHNLRALMQQLSER